MGASNNAPVTPTVGNLYEITIYTTDHSKNAVYTLTFSDHVTYTDAVAGAQTFDVNVSF